MTEDYHKLLILLCSYPECYGTGVHHRVLLRIIRTLYMDRKLNLEPSIYWLSVPELLKMHSCMCVPWPVLCHTHAYTRTYSCIHMYVHMHTHWHTYFKLTCWLSTMTNSLRNTRTSLPVVSVITGHKPCHEVVTLSQELLCFPLLLGVLYSNIDVSEQHT